MRMRLLMPVVACALLAAACSSSSSDTGSGGSGADATGTVTVFNAMEPQEATSLQKVVDDTINAKVKYKAKIEQSADFETQAKIRVDGGNPPEILLYPQSGAVLEQAKKGKAVALEDLGFTAQELEGLFGKYLTDLTLYNGKHYGLPTNVNLKSMVWYPKAAFDAKGYQVPKTFDEMLALSDKIKADGSTPWCVGFESGSSTGWPATDWMEDIMLRTAGPATYDKWVAHQIPFNDPAVKKAADLFGKVMFTPGYVLGGAANTTAIKFGDSPTPMFDKPPKCWLHRQASFINSFFPDTAKAGVDYDWFPFPSIDQKGDTALFGGEMATVMKDTPAVRDFLKRFAGQEVQCAQGKETSLSRVSPNINVQPSCYGNEQLARAATVLTSALKSGNGRFDASDLMPTAVGSGTFWTGMVKYVQSGPDSVNGVLDDIESSWPK
jgi:alpha-glucoside transport system substrate-binding protein